jgi:hypothetical protein
LRSDYNPEGRGWRGVVYYLSNPRFGRGTFGKTPFRVVFRRERAAARSIFLGRRDFSVFSAA